MDRRAILAAIVLGRPLRRQLRHVLRGARDGLPVAGGARRLPATRPSWPCCRSASDAGLSGRRAWIALGISLVGVVLAVGGIDPAMSPPVSGLLLAFASCFIYAVWVILAARLSGERREAVAVDVGRQRFGDGLGRPHHERDGGHLLGDGARDRPTGPPVGQIPSAAWIGLVGVGVGATFIAIQTFYAGARRVGAAHAALISTAEPIWTIALASILFSIVLTPVQLLGGVFIIVGGPRRRRRDRRRSVAPTLDGPRWPTSSRHHRQASATRGQRPAAASIDLAPALTNDPSDAEARRSGSRARGARPGPQRRRCRMPAALPCRWQAATTVRSAAW